MLMGLETWKNVSLPLILSFDIYVGVESLFGTVNNLIGTQGILLSIDMDVFDIGAIDEGEFYVKFILCNKYDCFKWALTIVYGSTQNDKEVFWLNWS